MQSRSLVFAVLALAGLCLGSSGASAQFPDPPDPPSCAALAAASPGPLWQVWFSGRRTDVFDYIQTTTAEGCFRSEAACKAWLYQAQSAWQHNNFRPCRRI